MHIVLALHAAVNELLLLNRFRNGSAQHGDDGWWAWCDRKNLGKRDHTKFSMVVVVMLEATLVKATIVVVEATVVVVEAPMVVVEVMMVMVEATMVVVEATMLEVV